MSFLTQGKTNWKYILIVLVLTVLVSGGLFWIKSREMPSNEERLPRFEKEIVECSPLDLAGYEVAQIHNNLFDFRVDLNGDKKEEIVRVYREKSEYFRALPIVVKIFSGTPDCPKEEFSYQGRRGEKGEPLEDLPENEVGSAKVLSNFWGDGRNVVMVFGISTGYGSGHTKYMHFFAFKNGKYIRVEGPKLDELSKYKFGDEKIKGNKIVVARAIWEEGEAHFDPHRYQFEIYNWNGQKYVMEKAGKTKSKYDITITIEEIIKAEPEVLFR